MKVTFEGTESFEAMRKAERYAKGSGLVVGSMERDSPIGLADANRFRYVAKWGNLTAEDKTELSGVIVGEKRQGPVTVVLFDEKDSLEGIDR